MEPIYLIVNGKNLSPDSTAPTGRLEAYGFTQTNGGNELGGFYPILSKLEETSRSFTKLGGAD
jgi:hypothetical protein